MLPPSPPTDPDVRVSRIRFFMWELCLRPVGYPLPFRGQGRGVQCPLPCFPPMALPTWRPPFPPSGPAVSQFPDLIGTMRALRLPDPHPRQLMSSPPSTTPTSLFVSSPQRS